MWRGLTLLAATEAGSRLKGRIASISFYAVAAVLGLVGILFALLALMIWLAQIMSASGAGLLIAAVLLGLALIFALIGRHRANAPAKRGVTLGSTALAAAPVALGLVKRRISLRTIAAVAAVGVGAILGRRIVRD